MLIAIFAVFGAFLLIGFKTFLAILLLIWAHIAFMSEAIIGKER